jgi:hypothetical protein
VARPLYLPEANLRKRKWFLLDEAVDQVRTDQIKSIIKQSESIIKRLLKWDKKFGEKNV